MHDDGSSENYFDMHIHNKLLLLVYLFLHKLSGRASLLNKLLLD